MVGTGSIARRHISNLLSMGCEVVVFSQSRSEDFIKVNDCTIKITKDFEAALSEHFDGVVIANQTHLHIDKALTAAKKNKNIFLEKPISNSINGVYDFLNIADNQGLVVETGFMLRLHPNLIWIKKYLQNGGLGDLLYIRGAVGQWLPDWRPGVDHRLGYGAFKESGGGVIFDLIHELDLCLWFGGQVQEVSCMTTNIDNLEIETEAIANINMRFKSGALGQLCLDYVRPLFRRTLEITGTDGVIEWDYALGEVHLHTRVDPKVKIIHKVDNSYERNYMFVGEMAHFLKRIQTPSIEPISSIYDGMNALKLALACHLSNQNNCKVVNLD